TQCERIVLTAELVADDAEVASQKTSQRPQQLESTRKPGHQNERLSLAPLLERGGVVSQVRAARLAGPRAELRTACRQPTEGSLHIHSPVARPPPDFGERTILTWGSTSGD